MSLPSKVFRTTTPKAVNEQLCVGCSAKVIPAFCYTGSVISDLCFSSISGTETLPITGVIRCDAPPPTVHLIGGEEIEVTKKVAFYKRKKGYICSDCAGNYHTVTDSRGNKHPIVQTDSRAGYFRESANTGEFSNRPLRILNTRRTQ